MFQQAKRIRSSGLRGRWTVISVLAILLLSVGATAQIQRIRDANKSGQSDDPMFREYRGVQIGMLLAAARQKLGEPTEKVGAQDLYVFSENESAQIFYDAQQTVKAISITFFGDGNSAPDSRAVLGREIERQADGSMHQLIRYPKAGYWIAYHRTAGESPVTTVVMQKLGP